MERGRQTGQGTWDQRWVIWQWLLWVFFMPNISSWMLIWQSRNSNEGSQIKPSPKAKEMEQPSKTEHFPTIATLPPGNHRKHPNTHAQRHRRIYTVVAPRCKSKAWRETCTSTSPGCNGVAAHPHRLTLLCQNGAEFCQQPKRSDFRFKKITSQRIKISNQIEIHNNTKMTKVRIIWHRF